jgi:hypothetical protein
MRKIYQNAQLVIVWLGIVQDRGLTSSLLSSLFAPRQSFGNFSLFSAADFREFSGDYHEYWQNLLGSSWFERLWVLQEVVWAQDLIVRHGLNEYSWDYLTRQAFRIHESVVSQRFGMLPIEPPIPPAPPPHHDPMTPEQN